MDKFKTEQNKLEHYTATKWNSYLHSLQHS
jgi:hypothetical protein